MCNSVTVSRSGAADMVLERACIIVLLSVSAHFDSSICKFSATLKFCKTLKNELKPNDKSQEAERGVRKRRKMSSFQRQLGHASTIGSFGNGKFFNFFRKVFLKGERG